MRFDRYRRLADQAEDETRAGGDTGKGLVLALLALAEAVVVTEDDGRREVSGSLTVDH